MFAEEHLDAPAESVEVMASAAGANESTAAASKALDAATRRAGRRKAAAQASLFDLANQKVVEELLNVDADKLSPEEAREILRKLKSRIM